GQDQRRTLAALRGRRAQLRPAGGDELRIGTAEFGRHLHGPVPVLRPADVAEHIDRRQHLLAEARRLLEDRMRELARVLGVERERRELLSAQQLIEYESQVLERRVVNEI